MRRMCIRYYWDGWDRAGIRFHWTLPIAGVLITPLLFIAVLPVLVVIVAVPQRAAAFRSELLPYWLCGWALWFSELHRKDIFHLVFAAPLLMILCVALVSQYRGRILTHSPSNSLCVRRVPGHVQPVSNASGAPNGNKSRDGSHI